MPEQTETNEIERRRWNDPYWSAVWPRREQLTGAVTDLLIDKLQLAPGEHVLDVGSGAGIASFAAAHGVGPTGEVVGADISRPLVELSSARARERHLANVRFVEADLQVQHVEGAPFDVAMSQFGVMFFDEPVRAFSNIRDHVRPGARLTFVCWQGLRSNLWHLNHAIAGLVPLPPPPAEGRSATGAFSLADPVRTIEILAGAGWHSFEREPHEVSVTVERDAILDDGQLEFLGVAPDHLDQARQAVERHLDGLRRSDGRFGASLAVQIFTALA